MTTCGAAEFLLTTFQVRQRARDLPENGEMIRCAILEEWPKWRRRLRHRVESNSIQYGPLVLSQTWQGPFGGVVSNDVALRSQ